MSALRTLLAALRAAGWRHSVEHHEGDRDWETGAFENSGYTVHRWTRRLAAIEVVRSIDDKAFIGSVVVGPREPEDQMFTDDTRLQVAVGWVARHGVARLHALAQAADVIAPTGDDECPCDGCNCHFPQIRHIENEDYDPDDRFDGSQCEHCPRCCGCTPCSYARVA